MKRNRIKVIIFITIVVLFAYGREHCRAMEWGGEEWDVEEADKFAEYEMNIVLDLLGIREWKRRSPGADEWDLPSDEPLGRYSEEALAPFLDGSVEIRVEIEYYTGGFRPDIRKVPVVIVKVYEDGRLTRIKDVICWGYDQRVESHKKYRDVELLGWKPEGQKIDNGPVVKQTPANFKPITRTVRMSKEEQDRQSNGMYTILDPENIVQVMETLLMTEDAKDKERLSELPLTERFYQQCMDAVPCVKDVGNMRGFWVHYYGIGDDGKVMCQCMLSPYKDKMSWVYGGNYYAYLVEMQLKDGQIDSMDIIFLGHYVMNGNTLEVVTDGAD